MRLIDAKKLYEKTAEWESQALEHVNRLNEQEGDEPPSLEWCRWNAILGERSSFKFDIMDAPTIEAVPAEVVFEAVQKALNAAQTDNVKNANWFTERYLLPVLKKEINEFKGE